MASTKLMLKTKLLIICIVPLLLVTVSLLWLTYQELDRLKTQQVESTRASELDKKRRELQLLTDTAVSSLEPYAQLPESEQRRQQFIDQLNALKYQNGGYFFLNSFDHIGIANGRNPTVTGQDLGGIARPKTVKRYERMVDFAKSGGFFLETTSKKKGQVKDNNNTYPKLT